MPARQRSQVEKSRRPVPNRLRWVPIWLLFAGGLINYMDRSALSVAAPLMMKELRLDAAQIGIVFSSFFAGYALFNFIGGYASDVLGPKRVLSLSMIVWSAFCGLMAVTTGLVSLLIVRTIFGFGEGPFSASANKVVANWFPRKQMGVAIGIANAGTPIGGALSGPVAGWLAVAYGWRVSFVVLALFGFVWILFWVFLAADKPDDQGRPDGVYADSLASNVSRRPISVYMKQPAIISTGIAFFGYSYILFFFLSWFPSYLTMAHHLDIRSMSLVNTIPWLMGTLGLALSGYLCDLLARVLNDVLFARKVVLVACLMLAAISVGAAGVISELNAAVALMTTAVFFIYLTGTTYWAIIQETVAHENIGGIGGLVHLMANCAGIIGPAVTGFIVQATGLFTSAFLLAGAVAVCGALLVAIYVKPIAGRRPHPL
jgi:MFS family permease